MVCLFEYFIVSINNNKIRNDNRESTIKKYFLSRLRRQVVSIQLLNEKRNIRQVKQALENQE